MLKDLEDWYGSINYIYDQVYITDSRIKIQG